MRAWSFVFLFPILFVAAMAGAAELVPFRRIRQSYVHFAQKASLGCRDALVATLKKEFGEGVYDPGANDGLFEFETEIHELFESAPEFRERRITALREKWGLGEFEIKDILTYYGIHAFDNIEVVGDAHEIFNRLQAVSKLHFLLYSDHPTAKRYLFYRHNVTKLSVPEMAARLGISEGDVYGDLSLLQISILNEFDRPLPERKFEKILSRIRQEFPHLELGFLEKKQSVLTVSALLAKAGKNEAEIARWLEVGEQALRFIRHHTHDSNRGVTWDRVIFQDGGPRLEIEILISLHRQGLNAQEIAQKLNHLAHSTATDMNFRTRTSVQAKLAGLKLTSETSGERAEIYHPEYGYLKMKNRLVVPSVTRFLFEHYKQSDEELAARLGVTLDSFREFCRRHHIVRLSTNKGRRFSTQKISTGAEHLLDKYNRQRNAAQAARDWIDFAKEFIDSPYPSSTGKRVSNRGEDEKKLRARIVKYRDDPIFSEVIRENQMLEIWERRPKKFFGESMHINNASELVAFMNAFPDDPIPKIKGTRAARNRIREGAIAARVALSRNEPAFLDHLKLHGKLELWNARKVSLNKEEAAIKAALDLVEFATEFSDQPVPRSGGSRVTEKGISEDSLYERSRVHGEHEKFVEVLEKRGLLPVWQARPTSLKGEDAVHRVAAELVAFMNEFPDKPFPVSKGNRETKSGIGEDSLYERSRRWKGHDAFLESLKAAGKYDLWQERIERLSLSESDFAKNAAEELAAFMSEFPNDPLPKSKGTRKTRHGVGERAIYESAAKYESNPEFLREMERLGILDAWALRQKVLLGESAYRQAARDLAKFMSEHPDNPIPRASGRERSRERRIAERAERFQDEAEFIEELAKLGMSEVWARRPSKPSSRDIRVKAANDLVRFMNEFPDNPLPRVNGKRIMKDGASELSIAQRAVKYQEDADFLAVLKEHGKLALWQKRRRVNKGAEARRMAGLDLVEFMNTYPESPFPSKLGSRTLPNGIQEKSLYEKLLRYREDEVFLRTLDAHGKLELLLNGR